MQEKIKVRMKDQKLYTFFRIKLRKNRIFFFLKFDEFSQVLNIPVSVFIILFSGAFLDFFIGGRRYENKLQSEPWGLRLTPLPYFKNHTLNRKILH